MSNRPVYIYDIDGVLTNPREKMPEYLIQHAEILGYNGAIVLVTGSDYKKVEEQLPQSFLKSCTEIYCCLGHHVIDPKTLTTVYKGSEFHDYDLEMTLDDLVREYNDMKRRNGSSHPGIEEGPHIEYRPGMINFSLLGRGAGHAERKLYAARENHRQMLCMLLERLYRKYTFSMGGEISIDIYKRGKDQIITWLNDRHHLNDLSQFTFFCDKIEKWGNDRSLASLILEKGGTVVDIDGPQNIMKYMENYVHGTDPRPLFVDRKISSLQN